MADAFEHELLKPIRDIGKQSGKPMRSIEKVTVRRPNAGDYVALEGFIADPKQLRPTAYMLGMVRRCSGLSEADANRLDIIDVRRINKRMEDEGFFDSGDDEETGPEAPTPTDAT